MDEQNNAPQSPQPQQPQQPEAQPEAASAAVQPTEAMPAPQGQPVDQTAPMPAQSSVAQGTQPPAPDAAPQGAQPVTQPAQPGAPIDPIMAQQNAMYNAEMGQYQQPPKPTGALVCGILSIVFAGVVGLILGIIALVQANKYFKAGGTEGTGKAGKICGIIGIVLSVIAIIAICALTAFGLAELNDRVNSSTGLTSATTTQSSSAIYNGSLSDASPEDEAAVYEVVDVQLNKIKNLDPAMVASISAIVADSLDDELEVEGISLADLQIDPTAFTTAMLQGFDYEHYYVDAAGDEAEANYHVSCKTMLSVMSVFYDQLMEMMEGDLSQYGTEAEAYAAIGQALMDSVEATALSEGELFDVELNKVGSTWIIDQDSWDDEIEYLFGV